MTKKLEPGCKAVTVNCSMPENNGKVVTLIEFAGLVNGFSLYDDMWITDCEFTSLFGINHNYMPASQLRRIDDDQETTTWEAMRDLWVPDQLKEREMSRD